MSSQVDASDHILDYSENQLNMKFNSLIPKNEKISRKITCECKLYFIKNTCDNKMSMELHPKIKRHFGVKFESNYIKIQNGE